MRGGSLDRKKVPKSLETALDPSNMAKTPVLCNKYVVNEKESPNAIHGGSKLLLYRQSFWF